MHKNLLVIGEHVWIGKNAFVMHGTNIGDGSIVGAMSVVKGRYPNNCVVGGNPAAIAKRDAAWSRDMCTDSVDRCGGLEYVQLTSPANAPISGLNVLVIGGTKFMGVQLVKELLRRGNRVTIATRGNKADAFEADVTRLIMDVSDEQSVKRALSGKQYDVVFDNLAYCSLYANNVLSNVKCKKYIQLSAVEAYGNLQIDMRENHFDPYSIDAKICDVNAGYVEGKRQAEAVAYQNYKHLNISTVRLPYVTRTDRLYYYCKHIVNQTPMNIDDTSRCFTFIRDTEVGKFLPWLAAQNTQGPINLASVGSVTIQAILDYIEKKVGKKAIIDTKKGTDSPFHNYNEKSYSLSMAKATQLGYHPSDLNDWFWPLMDAYIERAIKEKK